MIWKEIQSFIKGRADLERADDLEAYMRLAARRTTSVFDETERRHIFDLWRKYERMKSQRMEWDM